MARTRNESSEWTPLLLIIEFIFVGTGLNISPLMQSGLASVRFRRRASLPAISQNDSIMAVMEFALDGTKVWRWGEAGFSNKVSVYRS